MLYLGIDPGKSGGIAVIDDDTVYAYKLEGMTETDIHETLRSFDLENCFAVIEQVMAMPGKNAAGEKIRMGATSAFSFGQNYGFLRGLLIAMRIPFEAARPQKWQQYLGCMSKGDKNVTKAKAQQLFPSHKWTHATADAVLIAEYNRRTRT